MSQSRIPGPDLAIGLARSVDDRGRAWLHDDAGLVRRFVAAGDRDAAGAGLEGGALGGGARGELDQLAAGGLDVAELELDVEILLLGGDGSRDVWGFGSFASSQ